MDNKQISLIPNKLLIQKAIMMVFPCIAFSRSVKTQIFIVI